MTQGNYHQTTCHSNIKVEGILRHERTQVIELPWALCGGKKAFENQIQLNKS